MINAVKRVGKIWMALSALGLATASHAGIVDNFDGYFVGSINGQGGWLGTADLITTGAATVVNDPVSGAPDQALSMSGPSSAGNRGVYSNLGANTVADASTASLTFDFMVNTGSANLNVYFGLANSGAGAGLGDLEAYVGLVSGTFIACNGAANTGSLAPFTLDVWHTVKLVVNTTADTYDVFLNNVQVAANLVFKNSTGGPVVKNLDAVKVVAGTAGSGNTTRGYVDNVNLTFGTGGPITDIESFAAAASPTQRPNPVVLNWSVTGTISSLVIEPGIGDVTGLTTNGAGSVELYPLGLQTYTLTLNGEIGKTVSVVGLPEKEKLHIYLLIGQSNMQGEGRYYNASQDGPHRRVLKFGSRDGMERVFAEGSHKLYQLNSATGGDIGMGVAFGKKMIAAQTDPEVLICLINHAYGNTAIQWWAPGAKHSKLTTADRYLYDEAVQRVHDAEQYGVLKGVLWHQGEYNSGNQTNPDSEPELYAGRQQQLVDNLRSEFNNPSLPFICGKFVPTNWINSSGVSIDYARSADRDIIEAAGEDLPNHRNNTFCVDNAGLRGHDDEKIHFDAYSQRLLGQRYAAAMINFYSDPYLLYLGGYLTPAQMADPNLTDPQGDNDGDGRSNYLEYAFRFNPMLADYAPPLTLAAVGQTCQLSLRKRTDTEAPLYRVEYSTNLVDWINDAVVEVEGSPLDHGDGSATATFEPVEENPKAFFRIRVETD